MYVIAWILMYVPLLHCFYQLHRKIGLLIKPLRLRTYVIDCLRVMEKKTNVVVKPSVSADDTTQDEGVATATPVSVQPEVPSTEQGNKINMLIRNMYVHTYVHTVFNYHDIMHA